MSDYVNTTWCAGCGAEIMHTPFVTNQQQYCCQDCARGYVCQCGQAIEREDEYRDTDIPLEPNYPGS